MALRFHRSMKLLPGIRLRPMLAVLIVRPSEPVRNSDW